MIFTLKAKLEEFFPPDHPDTSWLLRLAVLRDDLAYEFERLALKPEDPPDEIWRCSYTLRKIAITLGEVKSIFCHEVPKMLEARRDQLPPDLVQGFRADIAALEEANEVLAAIRDGLGAHVRPSNAVQTKPRHDPTPEIVRAHGASEFEVRLDMETGRTTSFRPMTAASFMFAWPHVRTEEDYNRKHREIGEKLFACLWPVLHGIDMLLYMHWAEVGLAGTAVE